MLLQRTTNVILAVNNRPTVAELDALQMRRQLAELARDRGSATNRGEGGAVEILAIKVVRQGNRLQLLVREQPANQVAESRIEGLLPATGVRQQEAAHVELCAQVLDGFRREREVCPAMH